MDSIKTFVKLDILKEIIWTLVVFIASMVWSLALMLCIDLVFFAYVYDYIRITIVQFTMAAVIIAILITARHIYVTVKKYKKGDKSVL